MEIRSTRASITTTGSAGSATGTGSTDVLHGFLLDVYVDYDASAPGTTTVAIAYDEPDLGSVLSVGAGNTDARYAPRQTAHTTAGAVTDPDGYDRLPLNGKLAITVAASNALTDAVVVTIRYLGL